MPAALIAVLPPQVKKEKRLKRKTIKSGWFNNDVRDTKRLIMILERVNEMALT